MSSRVDVRDVTIRYGRVAAVERATLRVEPGMLAALVGPSGCGKTSLLRAIAGFEVPASGEIEIDGATMAGPGRFVEPEKRRVGMMFQQGALFPHLDVLANVAFGAGRERALEMLRLVGLDALAHRRPHELSGGQQQRVALARALAPSPRVILLDEPFGGLDAALRVRIRGEVREILHRTSTTGILVTHDQEEALSISDRVSVMHEGRILQTAAPREIYDAPVNAIVAGIIGDAALLDAVASGGTIATPFGPLTAAVPDGPCVVRVRPEDLQVVQAGGVEGWPRSNRFLGHQVIEELRLAGGEIVSVRCDEASAPGSTQRLALRASRVRVFSGELAADAFPSRG